MNLQLRVQTVTERNMCSDKLELKMLGTKTQRRSILVECGTLDTQTRKLIAIMLI